MLGGRAEPGGDQQRAEYGPARWHATRNLAGGV